MDTPADTAIARVVDILNDGPATDRLTLSYEARFLRRKRLVTDGGQAFLIDLARTTSLADGAVLLLSDGARIAVAAADEPLLEVRGDLARLAWHIGNRHAPCEVAADTLCVRDDPVMARMLDHLGAEIRAIRAPFRPEGGAYGHGRTHGHENGTDHTHDHGHDHG